MFWIYENGFFWLFLFVVLFRFSFFTIIMSVCTKFVCLKKNMQVHFKFCDFLM